MPPLHLSTSALLQFCRGCWIYCRVTRCRGIKITGIQQPWGYKGQKTQALLLCLITSAFILPAVLHRISAGSPGHQSTRAHQHTLQITRAHAAETLSPHHSARLWQPERSRDRAPGSNTAMEFLFLKLWNTLRITHRRADSSVGQNIQPSQYLTNTVRILSE